MDAALLGAVVGALLGAGGAYVFDIRKEQRTRAQSLADEQVADERRRAAVASALVHDLRSVESSFRQFYESASPSRMAISRPRYAFDALVAETRWFGPKSIFPIAELFARVDLYFIHCENLKSPADGRIKADSRIEYQLRAAAAFVLQMIPNALQALRSEGAIVDADEPWKQVTYPTLPSVPEPSFNTTTVSGKALPTE